MSPSTDEDERVRREAQARRLAGFRFVLGSLQMGGALISVCLLLDQGLTTLSLGFAVGTCFLTTVSVIFFGSRRPSRGG